MVSRTLSLAAASLIGCLLAGPGQAQQNLDAGKSAAQIFNGNCGVCHRSAKGLLKTVSPSSLPGFLREHYTTGSDMAQMLSAYLTSNRSAALGPDAITGKRGTKPQAGPNLRSDAPVGNAATPGEAGLQPAGPPSGTAGKRRRGRPEITAHPPEGEQSPRAGMAPKAAKRGRRGQPPVTPEQPVPSVASEPEQAPPKASDRSIDAAVPVPEPVVLPPPSAADLNPNDVKPAGVNPAAIKPEAPPASAEPPSSADKSAAEHPAEPLKPDAPAEAAATAPHVPPPSQ